MKNKISKISVVSNKKKNITNDGIGNNIILTKNQLAKEIIYNSNYDKKYSNDIMKMNLLDRYKNNAVKGVIQDPNNYELFDNPKKYCISTSCSCSLNIKEVNNNRLFSSLTTNLKNKKSFYNQKKTLDVNNSYKKSNTNYFFKKISNKKTQLNKNIKKNEIGLKYEDNNKKDLNNKNGFNLKSRYEKKESKNYKVKKERTETLIFEKLTKDKNLTSKQKAYILLCTSPILRLKEQIILSYNPIIKNNISITDILKNHEIILKNKITELNEEIDLCSNKLNKNFIASKIADVTLNFITSFDEQEFRDFDLLTNNKSEIKLYYNFIKILYILLDETFNSNDDNKKIKCELFSKINKKGFKTLKDYLYYIYIANYKTVNPVKNVDFINEIIKNEPNIMNNNYCFRMCRFMAFSIFLIREIINYANSVRDTIELKIRTNQFVGIVVEKLNKIKIKNNTLK